MTHLFDSNSNREKKIMQIKLANCVSKTKNNISSHDHQ